MPKALKIHALERVRIILSCLVYGHIDLSSENLAEAILEKFLGTDLENADLLAPQSISLDMDDNQYYEIFLKT